MKRNFFNIIVFILCLSAGGMISALSGQDISWDFLYYHLYNPYAFLNNRFDMDFMLAGAPSYFNPLLDIPYYLMITKLSAFPRLVAFMQGLYYGIAAFMVWLISFKFFKVECKRDYFFPLAAFVIGITNVILLMEIGLAFNDIQVTAGILLSVYILMCNLFSAQSKKRLWLILLSGFVAGAVSGFKTTGCLFCVGIFAGILFNYKQIKSLQKTLLLFVLGCAVGFLLTNGFWMYKMWEKFQNPVFPMFHSIFKSPYYISDNGFDRNFVPHDIIKIIFFPFYWHKSWVVSEVWLADFRYLLSYIILVVWGVVAFIKNKVLKIYEPIDYYKNVTKFIIIFIIVSYFIWMFQFSHLRYLMPVSCLIGIIIIASIKSVFKTVDFGYKVLLIFCIMFFAVYTGQWIFNDKTFDFEKTITAENLNIEDGAIVFLDTSFALPTPPPAYLAVFQNPKAHFIGVSLDDTRFMTLYFSKPSFSVYETVINKILSDGKPHKIYYISKLFYAEKYEKIKLLKENSKYIKIKSQRFAGPRRTDKEGFRDIDYYLIEPYNPVFFEYSNHGKTKIKFKDNL
jgi:hypothetical protein